jgi:hypothetical protein
VIIKQKWLDARELLSVRTFSKFPFSLSLFSFLLSLGKISCNIREVYDSHVINIVSVKY